MHAVIPRAHLFEIGDHARTPALIRDLLTDTLQFGATTFGMYDPVVPLLADLLRRTGTVQVVDLCSGGTGPWLSLADGLRAAGVSGLRVTFTDHRPNSGVYGTRDPRFHAWPAPVDAANVPDGLRGVRTLFTALHHFRPDAARAVFANAREAHAPLAVFEVTERTPASCAVACAVPLGMWLTTPLMRPLTWQRLALTYALPVLPLANLWDGVVSCLRSYTPAELAAMTADLGGADYRWDVGRTASAGWGPAITWLIGAPVLP